LIPLPPDAMKPKVFDGILIFREGTDILGLCVIVFRQNCEQVWYGLKEIVAHIVWSA